MCVECVGEGCGWVSVDASAGEWYGCGVKLKGCRWMWVGVSVGGWV